jgi:peptide chain release factor subunit 1
LIEQDTGKYCFGIDDTLKCLDSGAVDLLLVWENLDHIRLVVKSMHSSGVEEVHVLTPAQAKDPKWYRDEENGCEKEVIEKIEVRACCY